MDPFTLGLVITLGINAIDMFSGLFGDNEQVKALKREQQRVQDEKDAKLNLLDLQFKEAKDAANKSADRSDLNSDMNENTVSNQTNAAIEQLSLQQIADAYSFNYAAEQSSAETGNALSAQAVSGTRTSSVMDAVDMQAAQSAQQLQLAEDQARAGYDANLDGILAALAQNRFQIQNNRTDAIDLRASYEKGGNQYEIYSANRGMTEKAYNNKLQDIGMELDDYSGWKNSLRAIGRLFGVKNAGTGYQLGQNIADFGSPTFRTETNYSFDNVAPKNWQANSLSYMNGLDKKSLKGWQAGSVSYMNRF